MTISAGGLPISDQVRLADQRRARLIAFYLPQFHPIPENDAWWGKGFTEWTNVAKARPLFPGHYQPHIPADLGFYDLRVPETRAAQAEMAGAYGIEGFCYWHYWFAGKRLLERPFNEVLKSGQPKFPFCLAWANQTWTGIWYGAPERILIEQTYPGIEDYRAHFYAVLDAFMDSRYMTVEGKPIFVLLDPDGLPESRRFTDSWRDLALKSGLKGIYFVGLAGSSWDPEYHGFDASILSNPATAFFTLNRLPLIYAYRSIRRPMNHVMGRLGRHGFPVVYAYKDFVKSAFSNPGPRFEQFPCVVPNWDNTPRSNANGAVLHGSTPELFRVHLRQAMARVLGKEPDKRVIFVKSWNEWAEGNYLEPDLKFGKAYLQVIRDETCP